MLTSDQAKNITSVYNRLLKSEENGWSTIDDSISYLEWLDDDQLYKEAESLYGYHKDKVVGSPYGKESLLNNFVRDILEAVESICELYEETGNLHPRNRYIIYYYVALCQAGQIIILD